MPKVTTDLFGELALLPMQAERPVYESLEWLTDITEAADGSEDRVQLRSMPRQTMDYTIPLNAKNVARAFNTEYGAMRDQWAVPIWTEAQYLGAAVGTVIFCGVDDYDLRDQSLALFYRDDQNWDLVEIDSVASGSGIVLSSASDITSGVWIIPVRLGRILGNIDKPTNGYTAKSRIKFDIKDKLALTPAAPTQYLDDDIYFDASLIANVSDRSLQQQIDIVDGSIGDIYSRTTWETPRFSTPYKSLTTTAAEMRAYKNFLYRRAGRYRAFWLPTFEVNLRCRNVGTIVSTLYADRDSYMDYAQARNHIAIEDTAGNWYARAISAPVEVSDNRVQFTLSSALNISAASVRRISYLGKNRLDTDSVDINWIGNGVAESIVRVLELSP